MKSRNFSKISFGSFERADRGPPYSDFPFIEEVVGDSGGMEGLLACTSFGVPFIAKDVFGSGGGVVEIEMSAIASRILNFNASASSISFCISSTSHTSIMFSLRSVIVHNFSSFISR